MAEAEDNMQVVYRAVHKGDCEKFLTREGVYSLSLPASECVSRYEGKNNLDYYGIVEKHGEGDSDGLLHYFKELGVARDYAKLIERDDYCHRDTCVIAFRYDKQLLDDCAGLGLYGEVGDRASVQKEEYAVPVSQYNPEENLLGVVEDDGKISPVEPKSDNQVFYDPDNYSGFFF